MKSHDILEHRIRHIRRALLYILALMAVVVLVLCFVSVDETYEAYGKVVPRDETVIYAPDDCFVREGLAETGERVEEGDLLLRLDTEDLDAAALKLDQEADRLDVEISLKRLEKEKVLKNPLSAEFRYAGIELDKAEARVEHYKSYLGMIEDLAQEGIISQLELGEAKLAHTQAEADLKRDQADQSVVSKGYAEVVIREAQAQLELSETLRRGIERERAFLEKRYARRRIVAPTDGLLVACERGDPGEPVRKGEVLFRIARSDEVTVELQGPEANVNRVSAGQPVRIESLVFNAYKYGYAKGKVLKVAGQARPPEESLTGEMGNPVYPIQCSVDKLPRSQTLPLGSRVVAKITLRRSNLILVLMGVGWPS